MQVKCYAKIKKIYLHAHFNNHSYTYDVFCICDWQSTHTVKKKTKNTLIFEFTKRTKKKRGCQKIVCVFFVGEHKDTKILCECISQIELDLSLSVLFEFL